MTEFQSGYQAARLHVDDREYTLDGKSRAFCDGFSLYMEEQSFLAGNPDTDSFDY